ncbi:MAG: flagellar motor protein MotB [Pseudomonadota bacterium]
MATYSSVQRGRGRSHRRGESRRPGQWKLAYADFLTALMAFFLLLWLSTESSASQRADIAAYFKGHTEGYALLAQDAPSEALYANVLTQLEENSSLLGLLDHIRLSPEEHGLRIELSEAAGKPLFALGDAELNAAGTSLVRAMAHVINPLPGHIRIEGHTDAYSTQGAEITNWDISVDRANAARRVLQHGGVSADRIKSVSGLADTVPLLVNQPHAPANRRISIVLVLQP